MSVELQKKFDLFRVILDENRNFSMKIFNEISKLYQ